MADDQNESNNKNPPNSLRQIGERLSSELRHRPAEERALRERIARNEAILTSPQEVLDRLPTIPNRVKTAIQYHKDAETLSTKVMSDVERRNIQMAGIVGKQYSQTAMNTIATEQRYTPEVAARSHAMNNLSWEDLQQRRKDIAGEMTTLQGQAESAVRGDPSKGVKGLFTGRTITDPNNIGRKDIYEKLDVFETQKRNIGLEMAAIQQQERERKLQGLDPRSREETMFKYRNIAQNQVLMEDIKARGAVTITDPSSGQQKDVQLKNVTEELSRQFKELANDTRQLSKATAEEAEKIKQRMEERSQAISDLETAKAAGGGSRRDQFMSWAGTITAGFGAAGNAIQQIGVNQRLGQVSNIAGFANIENQKYDMYKKARGGDVMSQMLLSQWGQSEAFGGELRTAQQAALGAYATGGAVQTAAGAMQVASTLNPAENVLTTSQAQANRQAGVQNIAQGLSTTAIAGMDMYRGVSAGAVQIQGTQAQMEARRAVMQVQAEQLQTYRDFAVGAGTVAQGMGARGGAFLNQVTDANIADENMMRARQGMPARQLFTERLAAAGLSPEQFNQMAQIGVNQMGSTFDTNQVFAARGLERSGFGSMEQNMQRMSQLAQVGSNNPQGNLASVLEAAVGKGFDSSKSMDILVQNTAQMVQQNATATAAGIDVSGAAATLLAAGTDPNSTNREFAAQRALTAKEAAQSIMSNTDVSFAGMVNTSRISRMTGLSGDDAIYAAKLSTEQLRTMQQQLKEGKEGDVRKALMDQGVNPNSFKGGLGKGVDQLLESSLYTLVEGKGVGFASGTAAQRKNIVNAMSSGDLSGLTDEERTLMGKIGAQVGVTGTELGRTGAAVKNAQNDPNASTTIKTAIAGEGGDKLLKDLDTLRTSGFKQLSEQATQAQKAMQQFGGALKSLVDLNRELEGRGTKGAESDFATAAAKASETFGQSTQQFDTSVKAFGAAVSALSAKAGLNYDPGAAMAKEKLQQLNEQSQNAKSGPKRNGG